MMRIATWNINSLRLRLDNLKRFIQLYHPDIICLQEIKVHDDLFPLEAVKDLGYPHILHHGMKSYNGVAILSKIPFKASIPQSWCRKEDCRHALAILPGDIALHNFYVPAGGDIPDPKINIKFDHKLNFLDEVTSWFQSPKGKGRSIILGDLNVAPLEQDVWSHKQLLKVVSHTPIEVEKLSAWQNTRQFVDALRQFIPPEEKLYSWWSYRSPDWTKNDRGRRLDHIWVSPDLKSFLKKGEIVKEMRGWELASDHVPVLIDLAS